MVQSIAHRGVERTQRGPREDPERTQRGGREGADKGLSFREKGVMQRGFAAKRLITKRLRMDGEPVGS